MNQLDRERLYDRLDSAVQAGDITEAEARAELREAEQEEREERW